RLGVLGDWDNPYLTMDFKTEADIMRSLGEIYKNGYLYQGSKPVHWCVDCGSALAEAEVEYEDKNSPAIDVGFKFSNATGKSHDAHDKFSFVDKAQSMASVGKPIYAVIWTTTPWTLPANQAVCVHPELTYDLVDTSKGLLVLAHELVQSTLTRYGELDAKIIASCKGADLEWLKLEHPFDFDPKKSSQLRTVPVICGDHVTTEAGTGLVHTAPAHGLDDYAVGMRYGLSVDNRVDDHGKFFAKTPLVGGMSVWDANKVVIEALQTSGNLMASARLNHSYPHCWRHKTPVIFCATHQWFIGMDRPIEPIDPEKPYSMFHGTDTLRKRANEAVADTEFFPAWGRARLEAMIKNRPDWCVSRQRNWGVPMPLFVHKESGELHPQTMELLEKVCLQVEQQGIEAWFSLDAETFLGADAKTYKKVTDTLDVWFDSGVTHASVLKRRPDLQYPADLYLEGSDQHRGWFQSSLLTGCAIDGRAPYEALLTHGFVVDGAGHKMSKSKGNV
ncbi:MAG TPA: class I tRNA ligase family protein, partial [Methylophilaceae bacterium]